MPVFKAGEDQAPAWSELQMFDILELESGSTKTIAFRGPKEKYVCLKGKVRFAFDGSEVEAAPFTIVDVPAGVKTVIRAEETASVMRLAGSWGDEVGGSGVFPVFASESPENPGDPAGYERNASFDNHYHDCDEYWIVFSGSGRAVSEGIAYEVGPGDCIATGRGHHHDFPVVYEPVSAVFFETTLVGQKRPGHLWNHKHGEAVPEKDRV